MLHAIKKTIIVQCTSINIVKYLNFAIFLASIQKNSKYLLRQEFKNNNPKRFRQEISH